MPSILSFFRASIALALALPFAVHANQCSFEWRIKARGMTVGVSRDTVRWDNASVSVHSLFTPNAMAALLGAPTMERRWNAIEGGAITREESKFNSKDAPENAGWRVLGGKISQTTGPDKGREHPAPTGSVRFIDSTVFPYLELVGQPLEGNATLWVLNRQAPYPAAAKRSETTLEYTADNKHGTVWISTGKPTKLAFTEGRDSFEATVVSTRCK